MKHFFLLAALLYSLAILPQNYNKEAIEPIGDSKFSIGSKGGYGHSFLMPYNNWAYNSSWNVGLSMMYSPSEHFGLVLDGVFSSEGAKFRSGEFQSKMQFDYFRIPLKATVFFRKYENDLRPKFGIGPTLGILLNDDKLPSAAKTDWGANVAAGVNYRLLRGFWLTLDLDYYQGFTDVIKNNLEKDRNGNLRLNIGLMVGL
jgi:hypothetical protein